MTTPDSANRPQGQDRAATSRGLFAVASAGFRNPKSGGVMRICGLAGDSAGVCETRLGRPRRACP